MLIKNHNILILGSSGMLGNAVAYELITNSSHNLFLHSRTGLKTKEKILEKNPERIITEIKFDLYDNLLEDIFKDYMNQYSIDLVINCIGLIKQKNEDYEANIYLNASFPHFLRRICNLFNAKLIHVSTDCVFTNSVDHEYSEIDKPNAQDIYGISKRLGELNNEKSLTLRTSIIGHELTSNYSLLDWFLSQKKQVEGYKHAIFSGVTSLEFAKIILKIVCLPNIKGLYNVASNPISKYDLLKLASSIYQKDIEIIENVSFTMRRVLDARKFNSEFDHNPKSWEVQLIELKNYYDDIKDGIQK